MAPFVRNNKQQVKRKRFERSIAICLIDIYDQAMKGVRRMPWHQAPMKDVISCDKPRGVANKP